MKSKAVISHNPHPRSLNSYFIKRITRGKLCPDLMMITCGYLSSQETGDLEEVLIHLLVEDIPQEEVLLLCSSPDQQESIKAAYRELPNIAKSIGTRSISAFVFLSHREACVVLQRTICKL